MDRGAWKAVVHGVAKSRTWLSDFTFTFHFHALENEMASHSSVLDWRIPGTEEPWWAAVYGVTQSQTQLKQLSSSSSLSQEKAMAPHSSTLAWKIPGMEGPGRLQSMELLRVGHDWETSLSLFTFMHWRRKWQPTPVFLPGESQGWGSLVGCRLWGRTELDTTEAT